MIATHYEVRRLLEHNGPYPTALSLAHDGKWARLFQHLHKDAGIALYGSLALEGLRARLGRR